MKIILYTKVDCGWCSEAVEYLKEKNIPFEEREVWGNPEYFREMMQKSGQQKAPTLDFDGEILADTDQEAIDAFLRKRGVVQ